MAEQKYLLGFCIANDMKVPRMIMLKNVRGVQSISEWKKNVNISKYKSPQEICFCPQIGFGMDKIEFTACK